MSQSVNRFVNFEKMVDIADSSWDEAHSRGLIDLPVSHLGEQRLRTGTHTFINMCSCSYLGLDTDQRILQGAKQGIEHAGTLHLTTARVRMYIDLLGEVEARLSDHYQCEAVCYNSCATATSAFLPLLASGILTEGIKPVLAVDKSAHFSIQHIIPICGDETEVVKVPHNDTEYIENLCKKHKFVAFVGDGTYSMGGNAPIHKLLELQQRYGLFLYLDDSHGLSITGKKGWGFARSSIGGMNGRTIVVASLAKAFGACGAVLMAGTEHTKTQLVRYGNSWSQYLNSAGLGAILASLQIHESNDLCTLQDKLWRNIAIFDRLVKPIDAGEKSPIRLISMSSPQAANTAAERIYAKGFYTSPVFFPIVPRGSAGLRVMPRASLDPEDISRFSNLVAEERDRVQTN